MKVIRALVNCSLLLVPFGFLVILCILQGEYIDAGPFKGKRWFWQ